MKILILSDLHNEFGNLEQGHTNCDAVVLAGDTDTGSRGAKWALETFKEIPIIYICGNHEYYGNIMYKIQQYLKELSVGTNLFYLMPPSKVLFTRRHGWVAVPQIAASMLSFLFCGLYRHFGSSSETSKS